MIAYVDSSLITKAILADEAGHLRANELITSGARTLVTGTWTIVEVTGALVRARRSGRLPADTSHEPALRGLLGPRGHIVTVEAPQVDVERDALRLVTAYGLRAMDAWHLSVAHITLPQLAIRGQKIAFASRDADQAKAAAHIGLIPI